MGPRRQSRPSRLRRRDPAGACGSEPGTERINDAAEIRTDKVNRVRSAIAEGSYDEETLLERALESLADDIGVVCPAEDEGE